MKRPLYKNKFLLFGLVALLALANRLAIISCSFSNRSDFEEQVTLLAHDSFLRETADLCLKSSKRRFNRIIEVELDRLHFSETEMYLDVLEHAFLKHNARLSNSLCIHRFPVAEMVTASFSNKHPLVQNERKTKHDKNSKTVFLYHTRGRCQDCSSIAFVNGDRNLHNRKTTSINESEVRSTYAYSARHSSLRRRDKEVKNENASEPGISVPTTPKPTTLAPTAPKPPTSELTTKEFNPTPKPGQSAPKYPVTKTPLPSTSFPESSAPTASSPTNKEPAVPVSNTQTPTGPLPTIASPRMLAPSTSIPLTFVPTTDTPVTEAPTISTETTGYQTLSTPVPTSAPSMAAPNTPVPLTFVPTSNMPVTSVLRIPAQTMNSPISSTFVPTSTPSTQAPTTSLPITFVPTSDMPATNAPPFATETPVSPTPTTPIPFTFVPTSDAPVTEMPTKTAILPATPALSTPVPTPTTSAPLTFIPTSDMAETETPTTLTKPSSSPTLSIFVPASDTTEMPSISTTETTVLPTTPALPTPVPNMSTPEPTTSAPLTFVPTSGMPVNEEPRTPAETTYSPTQSTPLQTSAPITLAPTTSIPLTFVPTSGKPVTEVPTETPTSPASPAPSNPEPTPTSYAPLTFVPTSDMAVTEGPTTLTEPSFSPTQTIFVPASDTTELPTISTTETTIFPTTPALSTPVPTVSTPAPTPSVPLTFVPTSGMPVTAAPTTPAETTLSPTQSLPVQTSAPSKLAPTTFIPLTFVPTSGKPVAATPTIPPETTLSPTTPALSIPMPTTFAPTSPNPTTSVQTTPSPTTLAPTPNAPITPTSLFPTTKPTLGACPITIVIQFDDYPQEIGWSLRCGDKVYVNVAAPFNEVGRNERIEETFWIEEMAECEFSITDAYGDGLCCQYSEGFYEVFLGEKKTRNENDLIVTGAAFGSNDDAFFTVECLAPTSSPYPTPSPSDYPSIIPSSSAAPSSSPSYSPTPAPSGTPRPTALPTSITVVIQLDQYPDETSWSLQCGGVTYANVTSPYYFLPKARIEETFQVEAWTECLFVITDNADDGLCCTYGTGFFQIFAGDTSEVKRNLLVEGGEFGARGEYEFTAVEATPTTSPVPSPSPSSFPSLSPTVTFSPTKFSDCEINDSSKYNICIDSLVSGTYSTDWTRLLEKARTRWESIITGDVSPGVTASALEAANVTVCNGLPAIVDDLYICAKDVKIDGPGGIIGGSKITAVPFDGGLPIAGLIEFDEADLQDRLDSGGFEEVILHEIGHLLGIGSMWEDFGLTTNYGTDSSPAWVYNGTNACLEWQDVTNCDGCPPVQNEGGRGTAGYHWDNSVMERELMTGFAETGGGSHPISLITIGSLEDLGYAVNYSMADAYSFSSGSCQGGTLDRRTSGGNTNGGNTFFGNIFGGNTNVGNTLSGSSISGNSVGGNAAGEKTIASGNDPARYLKGKKDRRLEPTKPHLSDQGMKAAKEYGKKLLAKAKEVKPEKAPEGLVYTADRHVNVIFEEQGKIFFVDVHAENDQV